MSVPSRRPLPAVLGHSHHSAAGLCTGPVPAIARAWHTVFYEVMLQKESRSQATGVGQLGRNAARTLTCLTVSLRMRHSPMATEKGIVS